jgi:hypothetical protein
MENEYKDELINAFETIIHKISTMPVMVHDGLIFFFSKRNIECNEDVIGFYYDVLGHLHSIKRNSVFGHCVITHLENRKMFYEE